ncbi:tetratricopeptide repeat protein [Flagellimonas meridianipacifica]|uniref:histidine kinase n=1 Tax=Flagellimonas meridianipacifica TaxID=1080225 RepID=A0A2T0MK01_9FLAO|nr:tetratricopeptide repeat protein [Allomuricauda pacifica]PRX57901.1 tetratricopeptide repeat protein [Allomuricauda pacifica]
MTRYLCFVLVLLCFGAHAQEAKRDSLVKLLARDLTDTTRVNALIEMAKIEVDAKNKSSADSLFQSALTIARQMNRIDDKAKAFESVGHYQLKTRAYDSAVIYYKKALEIDKEQNNILALARNHDNAGTAYFYKGDYNQTLYHFLERLSYCEQLGDSTCVSAASNNSGLVLINLGRYEDAISYTLRSLKIDEDLGYKQGILSSQMSLGNINYYLKNYDKAIEYYLDIVATCETMENQELRISHAYNNIASIHFQQKEFKKAAEFYKKSLVLEEEFGNEGGIALKYNNLGSVHKELNEYSTAESYYRKALSMREELGDLYGMSSTENNLGQLYLAKGVPAIALGFYQSALGHAEQAGSLEASKIAYEGIAKSYKNQGRYRLSLESYEHFLRLNDSLLNAEKTKKITELEARYDSEKKESEIALLKKNEELQQAQLVQQEASLRANKLLRNILFVGVAVLLIVVFLIVYGYKQRLAAKELVEKNQRETEAIRSRFFAGISHEFRTPLTLISAPVVQLQKKYQNEKETYGMLGLIHRNADRLLKLINQILDLSKLEEGKLRLHVAKDSIISWLRVISASFTSLADSKNITFTQSFPETDIISFFDKEKIEQILSNLLSNALKFTPNGGKVALLVEQNGQDLNIEVRNTGPQISEEDKTKIFERFYQSDIHDNSQGTGIGLALVKELTELHHGSVAVQSNKKYTTFSLLLPLNDDSYATEIKVEPKDVSPKNGTPEVGLSEESSLDPANQTDLPIVLLAEDHRDLRSYVSGQLSDMYSIKEAQNGRMAWEVAEKELPDLIITDLMMPEMDGEAFLEKIRGDSKTQHIPIIMLTARKEQESKLKTIGKGADHFLTKPFEIEELRVRIKSLLEQRKRIQDYHKSQFLTNPKAEAITSSDDRFLQKVGHILAKNLDNSSFSVDEFADKMSMSRVQLYRKMKATIGYSVSDFIRQYRLKKAYEYLKSGKGTVSEIAYDVGFNNLSYFTKAFKEAYNLKPSEMLQKTS